MLRYSFVWFGMFFFVDFLQVDVDVCDVTRMIAVFIEYGLWDKVSRLESYKHQLQLKQLTTSTCFPDVRRIEISLIQFSQC